MDYGLPKSIQVNQTLSFLFALGQRLGPVIYFELPGVCQRRPHPVPSREFNCFKLALYYGAGDTRGYHFIYATMSISFLTGNTTAEGSMGCCPRPFCCKFCEGLCFPGKRKSGHLGLTLTLCLFSFFIQELSSAGSFFLLKRRKEGS